MDTSYFYSSIEEKLNNSELLHALKEYAIANSKQIYVIDAPMGTERETRYSYSDAIIVLSPKCKICIINSEPTTEDRFDEFVEDFTDDLGYLSDKYDYRLVLGRPRSWKDRLVLKICVPEFEDMEDLFSKAAIPNAVEQRNADFLISLLIGSINDVSRIGGEYPETILDQVKKKIILFDGDQSRFIYSNAANKKRIIIQGLAGTGKTELLLHKLKDLYINDKEAKIVFTCYNKILSKSMRNRIPEFFNFMRVEEQIRWEDRLWVMSSWGSRGQPNTGVYSYVCSKYQIDFYSFSYSSNFDVVCKRAIEELRKMDSITPCFDYMLIDESQDFPQSYFDLCELVTKNSVYIAGDIFQDIYDNNLNKTINSDYLLNKCYRTDPRTLMFAHAVGMGLYETPVIRWLEDSEWTACGYNYSRSDNKFKLSRAPIRRFEDIDMARLPSIKVISEKLDNFGKSVFSIIDEIKANHPTVTPGDIAIVFLESSTKVVYDFADFIANKIQERYGWPAKKGYETKDKDASALFISNRNNIKGLEFPFVICFITGRINEDIFTRNTIYMMLTRSFITSYFLVNTNYNKDFIRIYSNAAQEISVGGTMVLREPSNSEKTMQNQKVSIALARKQRPLKDIIEEVINEFPQLSQRKRLIVRRTILDLVQGEGDLSEEEIQERTRKIISALF